MAGGVRQAPPKARKLPAFPVEAEADGPHVEIAVDTIHSSIEWLLKSVLAVRAGLDDVSQSAAENEDLPERLAALEGRMAKQEGKKAPAAQVQKGEAAPVDMSHLAKQEDLDKVSASIEEMQKSMQAAADQDREHMLKEIQDFRESTEDRFAALNDSFEAQLRSAKEEFEKLAAAGLLPLTAKCHQLDEELQLMKSRFDGLESALSVLDARLEQHRTDTANSLKNLPTPTASAEQDNTGLDKVADDMANLSKELQKLQSQVVEIDERVEVHRGDTVNMAKEHGEILDQHEARLNAQGEFKDQVDKLIVYIEEVKNQLAGVLSEVEDKIDQEKGKFTMDSKNLYKAMKHVQKESEAIEGKVSTLWKKMVTNPVKAPLPDPLELLKKEAGEGGGGGGGGGQCNCEEQVEALSTAFLALEDQVRANEYEIEKMKGGILSCSTPATGASYTPQIPMSRESLHPQTPLPPVMESSQEAWMSQSMNEWLGQPPTDDMQREMQEQMKMQQEHGAKQQQMQQQMQEQMQQMQQQSKGESEQEVQKKMEDMKKAQEEMQQKMQQEHEAKQQQMQQQMQEQLQKQMEESQKQQAIKGETDAEKQELIQKMQQENEAKQQQMQEQNEQMQREADENQQKMQEQIQQQMEDMKKQQQEKGESEQEIKERMEKLQREADEKQQQMQEQMQKQMEEMKKQQQDKDEAEQQMKQAAGKAQEDMQTRQQQLQEHMQKQMEIQQKHMQKQMEMQAAQQAAQLQEMQASRPSSNAGSELSQPPPPQQRAEKRGSLMPLARPAGGGFDTGAVKEIKGQVSNLQEQVSKDSKELRGMVEALSGRIDAWTQSSNMGGGGRRRRRQEEEEEASSPGHAAAPTAYPTPSPPLPSSKSERTLQSGMLSNGVVSKPILSEKNVGHCHDKCKGATCPKSLAMSQSLGRLPKLKGAPLGQ